MASTVASSHFPVGCPSYAPSRFSAPCISRMRSGVGAFWPCAVGLTFFLELAPFFFLTDDCVAAVLRAAQTTGAALNRSTAPRVQSQVLLVIGFLCCLHASLAAFNVRWSPHR